MNQEYRDFVAATDKLNVSELKSACYAIGINPEDIGGGGKQSFVDNLYQYAIRQKWMSELYRAMASINPTIEYDRAVFVKNQERRAAVLADLRGGEKDAIYDALIYLIENL